MTQSWKSVENLRLTNIDGIRWRRSQIAMRSRRWYNKLLRISWLIYTCILSKSSWHTTDKQILRRVKRRVKKKASRKSIKATTCAVYNNFPLNVPHPTVIEKLKKMQTNITNERDLFRKESKRRKVRHRKRSLEIEGKEIEGVERNCPIFHMIW